MENESEIHTIRKIENESDMRRKMENELFAAKLRIRELEDAKKSRFIFSGFLTSDDQVKIKVIANTEEEARNILRLSFGSQLFCWCTRSTDMLNIRPLDFDLNGKYKNKEALFDQSNWFCHPTNKNEKRIRLFEWIEIVPCEEQLFSLSSIQIITFPRNG